MRGLAFTIAQRLISHAASERYPTRSVEYLLAWVMFVWGVRVLWPGDVLVGPTYQYLTVIAPEPVWGSLGVIVAMLRLYALARNGGWKRSPMLRLFGATLGLIWWLVMMVLFQIAIETGAADFPMRAAYPVFIFFEIYSCFRCGQDHEAMKIKNARPDRPAESPGHG